MSTFRLAIYWLMIWIGIIFSLLTHNPCFLFINFYLAPVFRFGSLKSFSLGLFDFTFNTEDGGLHMAMGQFIYAFIAPISVFNEITDQDI